jgi:hypothetical protein
MEVSGQLCNPAVLPRGEKASLSNKMVFEWSQSRSGHFGDWKRLLSLPEIERRLLYHTVGILATNCLRYPVSAFKQSTEKFTAAYAHRNEVNMLNSHTT